MTDTFKMGDYYIDSRELDNGWYELSTMAYSAGEWYRVHKRYDYKPLERDLRDFVQYVEGTR